MTTQRISISIDKEDVESAYEVKLTDDQFSQLVNNIEQSFRGQLQDEIDYQLDELLEVEPS